LREKHFCCNDKTEGLANNNNQINPQATRSLKSRDKMRREKLPNLKLIPHKESDKENLIPHLTG